MKVQSDSPFKHDMGRIIGIEIEKTVKYASFLDVSLQMKTSLILKEIIVHQRKLIIFMHLSFY